MACSNGPDSPAAPAAAVPGTSDAAADGSTLKATAPTPISPVNDERLSGRRPTMRINNSQGRFTGATFRYEFQILTDGGSVVDTRAVAVSRSRPTIAPTQAFTTTSRVNWARFGPSPRRTPSFVETRATAGGENAGITALDRG